MQTPAQSFSWRTAPTLELDPLANEERKRRASYHLNVVLNPIYRLLGFYLIALAVCLHNEYILGGLTRSTAAEIILLFGAYPLAAWGVMVIGYRRLPALAEALLYTDIIFLVLTVYFSGGEKSLLFFVPLFRVVDQTHTTFRRAMVLGHAAVAGYILLILYLVFAEGREVAFAAEAVKTSFLYGAILYTALTARSADARKRRTSEAIRVARESIESLEASSAELQRVTRRTELILQSVGDGIVGFDLDGRVTFANRRAAKTIGLEVEQLVGRKGHGLAVHCGDGGTLCDGANCPLEAALRSGKEERGENAGFFRKDGTIVPVAYSSAPVYEGSELVGAVFSFRDVTVRKRLESELTAARDAAEAGSRAKSVFLANMSHELRTPLNAIIGYSEMLQEELNDEGMQSLAADAVKIQTAGKRLLAMISDILDIAKLEAGRMRPAIEPVDLPRLIEEVASMNAPRFAARANRLEIASAAEAPGFVSDPTMLRRVLDALLDNANKFSSSATTHLLASADGEAVSFTVIDRGAGMSEEQSRSLFEPFTPGNAGTTKKSDGSGVGLALSKRLADALGGSLHVRSSVGEGSEFTFRVPLVRPQQEEME
jgi:PAS domain S-box-containing protein